MTESIIYQKLTDFFSPQHLEIINESHKHQGHSGSPNTGNSHFSVVIKSKKLNNVSKSELDLLKGMENDFNKSLSAYSQKYKDLSDFDIFKKESKFELN